MINPYHTTVEGNLVAEQFSDNGVRELSKIELYQNAPCGLMSFEYSGKILVANNTMLSWLRMSETELHAQSFTSIITKGGLFYFQMIITPLLNLQGYVNEINLDFKQSDRTTIPCLLNAHVEKRADNKDIIHAVVLKITDRKKYEAELLNRKEFAVEERKRFESLANFIPHLIFTMSDDGMVDFVNERFTNHFDYLKDEHGFTKFVENIYPGDRIDTLRQWKTAFKNKVRFEIQARLKNAGGTYDWFMIQILPYKGDNTYVSTWFGSCTNINEQKEREQQAIKQLTTKLTEADELIVKKSHTLKQIAFDQSHPMRMPLSNILGILEVIYTLDMSDDLKSMFTMLQQSADQLDGVIRKVVKSTYE